MEVTSRTGGRAGEALWARAGGIRIEARTVSKNAVRNIALLAGREISEFRLQILKFRLKISD
jgi:hypothetical protein